MHSDAPLEEITVGQDGLAIRGHEPDLSLPNGAPSPIERTDPAPLDLVRRSIRHGGDRLKTTLRILYATPRNPWTLVETLDKKMGAISRKP
jgi:hypothetical protein